jgi:hypothetical protein
MVVGVTAASDTELDREGRTAKSRKPIAIRMAMPSDRRENWHVTKMQYAAFAAGRA